MREEKLLANMEEQLRAVAGARLDQLIQVFTVIKSAVL